MKTTVDIRDGLLERAKRHAKETGRPLRAVIEEGLRQVLSAASTAPSRYRLPDASEGDASKPDPLERYSWQDLRKEIYGGPGTR